MLQKDFIEDWSPVALKAGKDIVPNVVKAVEIARERGILIVWVIITNLLTAPFVNHFSFYKFY